MKVVIIFFFFLNIYIYVNSKTQMDKGVERKAKG